MPTREELDALWADRANWHWGVYVCKADRRVIVPKRVRWLGWTVNFGHRLAWPFMVFLLVTTLAPFAIVMALGARHLAVIASTLVAASVYIIALCAWLSGRQA